MGRAHASSRLCAALRLESISKEVSWGIGRRPSFPLNVFIQAGAKLGEQVAVQRSSSCLVIAQSLLNALLTPRLVRADLQRHNRLKEELTVQELHLAPHDSVSSSAET